MVRDGSGDSAFSFTNALLQIGDNVSFVNNTADEQGGAIGLYDYALMRVDEVSSISQGASSTRSLLCSLHSMPSLPSSRSMLHGCHFITANPARDQMPMLYCR